MVQSLTRTRPAVISWSWVLVWSKKYLARFSALGLSRGDEGFEVVDHAVVEVVDGGAHDLFEQLEVEEEAGLGSSSAPMRVMKTL